VQKPLSPSHKCPVPLQHCLELVNDNLPTPFQTLLSHIPSLLSDVYIHFLHLFTDSHCSRRMEPAAHLNSIVQSGRAAQVRRQSRTAAQEEVAPDEYPTFTRPISPELDASKRYTQDPPKRKRTNPWSFRRNSNASESGDDCDRPLSRKLSRKASTVFHIFTPQRARSNASAALPQSLLGEPGDAREHVPPAAPSRHVTDERRRSSLQKLKDFIFEILRKDSAVSEKPYLPAPPLDDDDHAMGLFQTSSPKHPQSLYTADPDLIYMTGALPPDNPNSSLLEPLTNPDLTESKRRKTSAAAAARPHGIDADLDDPWRPFSPNLTGYSPPPLPRRRATHHAHTAVPKFPSRRRDSRRRFSAVPASAEIHMDMMSATPRHVVAPWDTPSDTDRSSPSTSAIGVLPSLSSAESASHVPFPVFALPSTTANSSTVALHTPSRPQSPAMNAMQVCPASPEVGPTVVSDGRPSTLTLPGPTFAMSVPPPGPALGQSDVAVPWAYFSFPSNVEFLTVPEVDTRPSTAADSTDEDVGELRLRRSGSLRREVGALKGVEGRRRIEGIEGRERVEGMEGAQGMEGMEGMQGYEFVERAMGWRVDVRARGR
jgi:hypothetical protein